MIGWYNNMEQKADYQVLLYYKYVPIENPEEYAAEHLEFCKSLGLKGRILVAKEGINGTVSGPREQTQKYMDTMHRAFTTWFSKLMLMMVMPLKKCMCDTVPSSSHCAWKKRSEERRVGKECRAGGAEEERR